MTKRGRPPSPRAASARMIHIKLRLYPGEDDDLIAFFDGIIPRLRAALVKQALRSGTSTNGLNSSPNDGDIFEALDSFVR
ncbi:MAG: hypothetical protein ACYC0V_16790 [Armatimonadota bacterium]